MALLSTASLNWPMVETRRGLCRRGGNNLTINDRIFAGNGGRGDDGCLVPPA